MIGYEVVYQFVSTSLQKQHDFFTVNLMNISYIHIVHVRGKKQGSHLRHGLYIHIKSTLGISEKMQLNL